MSVNLFYLYLLINLFMTLISLTIKCKHILELLKNYCRRRIGGGINEKNLRNKINEKTLNTPIWNKQEERGGEGVKRGVNTKYPHIPLKHT